MKHGKILEHKISWKVLKIFCRNVPMMTLARLKLLFRFEAPPRPPAKKKVAAKSKDNIFQCCDVVCKRAIIKRLSDQSHSSFFNHTSNAKSDWLNSCTVGIIRVLCVAELRKTER